MTYAERPLKILVACEESQAVTKEMRLLGHEAYSCDVLPCSGGHPEWHIQQDVIPLLDGNCEFVTLDGESHVIAGQWDMLLAFPPCTYLTVTGNRWFNVERYGDKARERFIRRDEAAAFFMSFVNANCERIAIENPIGAMSTLYRKPDQIVHPYYFGDAERKSTCLWLKNLPKLIPTDIVEPQIVEYKSRKVTDCAWHMRTKNLPADKRARERSKTFPGIAKAMAEQWAGALTSSNNSSNITS